MAFGSVPLLAVIVKEYGEEAAVPPAGVPDNVAVPFALSVKVTPLGKVAPSSLNAGAGNPEVITVKELDAPSVNVMLPALVIAGA